MLVPQPVWFRPLFGVPFRSSCYAALFLQTSFSVPFYFLYLGMGLLARARDKEGALLLIPHSPPSIPGLTCVYYVGPFSRVLSTPKPLASGQARASPRPAFFFSSLQGFEVANYFVHHTRVHVQGLAFTASFLLHPRHRSMPEAHATPTCYLLAQQCCNQTSL